MLSARDAILDEGDALLDPGLQRRFIRIEVHDRDALGIDVDVPQQNRQRAARDASKTDEQDSMRKCQHPVELLHPSFFTSTLEFRPLCSYFSRRAGGRSSGVPSAKPPLD